MTPAWVAQYVGLHYQPRGRDRSGVDCWGLVRMVLAEQFDIHEPEFADVEWRPSTSQEVAGVIQQEARAWLPIELGQERLGDVVVLRLRGHPIHVGLVVEQGRMLHAWEGSDATVESYLNLHWRHRIVGLYRHA